MIIVPSPEPVAAGEVLMCPDPLDALDPHAVSAPATMARHHAVRRDPAQVRTRPPSELRTSMARST